MADTADVDIESLSLDGDGIARLGRSTLTVPFTIPGERVRVRLGATRAGSMTAAVVEVLRASPDRVQLVGSWKTEIERFQPLDRLRREFSCRDLARPDERTTVGAR